MGLWRITISAEPKVKQSPEPTPAGGATKTHDFVPLTLLFLYGQPARFTHRAFLNTRAKQAVAFTAIFEHVGKKAREKQRET